MTNKLKLARTAQQLTQEELAKLAGVSRQSIHAIESGKYVPTTILALKLARILTTTVEQLFVLEEGD
ncbi:MAG: helix-turn-helix transcriptional regulator [Chitinophagaceae bacterium]|nr:helix-turn-helix transcriptional regulator [Chitinophagaceae bacterium]